MEMKLKVAAREVIKPASLSPRDRLQLSVLDLYCPPVYICNDKGAVFTEAHNDIILPHFLRHLNTETLEGFLPKLAPGDSPGEWPLLSVMVTFFGSGSGVAISVSVSVSHKICDARNLIGKSNDEAVNTIAFAETTIYPPPSPHQMYLQFPSKDSNKNITTIIKRFVFEPSKIALLRHKAASKSVPVPTRVEAIMSLLWKCARKSSRSNLVLPRTSVMCQAMDLRLRIPSTVLSQDAIGNLQIGFTLKKDAEMEKPFYKVDFGLGFPVWMGYASNTIYSTMVYVLTSTVEAWISLPEQDMAVFFDDQELLAYAIPNPPVMTT
ncbi:hypothetical protein CARUB_v10007198mg [Capsella rubella]|uniref:BAHD acyltransferase n=1 Tax=Capsella rubella TaxID=81985 RepID=R0GP25_9BRAS|nr:hypothetical protein CARUB_v10007198mg [Capsella rubella]